MTSTNDQARVMSHAPPDRQRAWPDQQIATIAGRQRGLITNQQLRQLGVSRRSITDVVARGRMHRVHTGVYSLVAVSAWPPLAAEQAALLACGPTALISHVTALSLWNLILPPVRGTPVHLTVVGTEHGRHRAQIHAHRRPGLSRAEVRRCQGLPVTSPALALLDALPFVSPRDTEQAFDRALARHLTSPTAIRETLARHPTERGARRLKRLLDPSRPSSMTESVAQERLLMLLRRTGLPSPETEQCLGPYRVDLMWRDQRLVVEFDGWDPHGGRRAFDYDKRRDNWMTTRGWHVLRVTWTQLTEEPEIVLVWIATELARAGTRR
jgi:very-short-patch-repair endonuclease